MQQSGCDKQGLTERTSGNTSLAHRNYSELGRDYYRKVNSVYSGFQDNFKDNNNKGFKQQQ